MPELDLDEVTKLLQIPQLVSTVAPGLTHITGEAMARLRKINAGLEEAKAKDAPGLSGLSGMPVHPAVPSQPLEAPESKVAEEAPEEHEPTADELRPSGPTPSQARAFPNPESPPTTAADSVRRI